MSIFERTVVKQVRTARKGIAAQYLVTVDGDEVGLLEKHAGKANETPWQAYHGIGMSSRYLGAWYGVQGRIQARNALLEAEGHLGGGMPEATQANCRNATGC